MNKHQITAYRENRLKHSFRLRQQRFLGRGSIQLGDVAWAGKTSPLWKNCYLVLRQERSLLQYIGRKPNKKKLKKKGGATYEK